MLVRDGIPAPTQGFSRPFHLRSRTRSHPATTDGPGGFRQLHTLLRRLAKRLAAARRKMAEFGSFTRGESLGGLEQ